MIKRDLGQEHLGKLTWDVSIVLCLGARDREVGLVTDEGFIWERRTYKGRNPEAERRMSLWQYKG